MHSVIVKEELIPLVIDKESEDYSVYIENGYSELFFGERRKCEKYVEELIVDLAPITFELIINEEI